MVFKQVGGSTGTSCNNSLRPEWKVSLAVSIVVTQVMTGCEGDEAFSAYRAPANALLGEGSSISYFSVMPKIGSAEILDTPMTC